MPLKARDVEGALTSKGFKPAERDHTFYFFYQGGKKTPIRTKISHGEREISDTNCSLMARQMHLSGPQFRDFVDCTIKEPEYLALMIQGGHLRPSPTK